MRALAIPNEELVQVEEPAPALAGTDVEQVPETDVVQDPVPVPVVDQESSLDLAMVRAADQEQVAAVGLVLA